MLRNSFKKISYIFVSTFVILGVFVSNVPKTVALDEDIITIYHTNDMHGRLDSVYSADGTLSQIGVDVLKTIKDSTKNSILVDGGDATQGVFMSTYSQGSNMIDLMNAAGYDVMTLGNHEFDYGLERAILNSENANFPVLAANIVYEDTGLPILKNINGTNGCNFIKEINGKKIGFFGICAQETKYLSNPNNIKNIDILDEITVSKQQVQYLKSQGVDAIIALTHMGVSESNEVTSKDLAENVDGIDVIIDGHSHTKTTLNVNNTVIQQVGTNSAYLGEISLDFSSGKLEIRSNILSAAEVGSKYKPDQSVTQIYNDIYNEQKLILQKVIGKTKTSLFGGTYEGKSVCRLGDTNLGCLIADSMLWSGRNLLSEKAEYDNVPVVAMQNGGGIRTSIEAGYITIEDVNNVLSVGNSLSLKEITPKVLYQTMEYGFSKILPPSSIGEPITGASGALPHFAGMRVELNMLNDPYDENDPFNENHKPRVEKIVLLDDNQSDYRELDRNDDETKMIVVSNSFEMVGGDGYTMLNSLPYVTRGDNLYNIFGEYVNKLTLENGGILDYPFDQHRLTFLESDKMFSNYNCSICVKEESTYVLNKPVNVTIDSLDTKEMYTDNNGFITLENLEQGNHLITIEKNGNSADVLVNDMSGLKFVTATIKDKTIRDIESVTNIISQIPSTVTQGDSQLVQFARTSYNSLNSDSQSKILNYNKLAQAERALSNLNNPAAVIGNNTVAIVVVSCFCIIILCSVIIINSKKSNKI